MPTLMTIVTSNMIAFYDSVPGPKLYAADEAGSICHDRHAEVHSSRKEQGGFAITTVNQLYALSILHRHARPFSIDHHCFRSLSSSATAASASLDSSTGSANAAPLGVSPAAALSCAAMSVRKRESWRLICASPSASHPVHHPDEKVLTNWRYVPDSVIRPSSSGRKARGQRRPRWRRGRW